MLRSECSTLPSPLSPSPPSLPSPPSVPPSLPPYLGHVTNEEPVLDPVRDGVLVQEQGGHRQGRGAPGRAQGGRKGGKEEGLGQREEGEDKGGGGRELHGWLAAAGCCCGG